MRTSALVLALLLASPAVAQPRPQDEVASLKVAGMERVVVRKNIAFEGDLKLDLYRPSEADTLPLVMFVNGVGLRDLKEWGQYTSWPRLVSMRGIAAITYQTASGEAAEGETESLLKYVKEHAAELKIDPSRIALWSCSANVRVATSLLAKHPKEAFRAAAFYYGIMTTPPKHAEVPVFIARANLDVPMINDSIDRWSADAVALDVPVTLVTYPQGLHGFDVRQDTAESRDIIRQTLDFLQFHLTTPRAPRTEPMRLADLQKLVASSSSEEAMARVREIRKTHPDAFVLQEQVLNGFGYSLLSQRKLEDAVKILEIAAALSPESPNAHDSLGDAYEAAGRSADAIASSERAIALLDKIPAERREGIRASAEDKLKRLRK